MGMDEQYRKLLDEAKEAMSKAYVPYSQFQVGAALLHESGKIYQGCNIENAAYGPTNCAERTALFSAIAQGAKPGSFPAIAVIGHTSDPIAPCGVCRQVLVELCSAETKVIMGNIKGDYSVMTVAELLPGAFTPSSLVKEEQQ